MSSEEEKTREDAERLIEEWKKDPCYDLVSSDGSTFSGYERFADLFLEVQKQHYKEADERHAKILSIVENLKKLPAAEMTFEHHLILSAVSNPYLAQKAFEYGAANYPAYIAEVTSNILYQISKSVIKKEKTK